MSHTGTVNVSSKSGPARVATLQDEFRIEVERRLRAIRGAVRKTIVDNDALRISQSAKSTDPRSLVNQPTVDPEENFPFGTDSAKIDGFMEWFEDSMDEAFLERTDAEAIRNGEHWTAAHIREAYEDGIEWADARANEAGIPTGASTVTRLPAHPEALRTLYTRTYEELDNLTNDAATNVRRVLTDGFDEGLGPHAIARNLTDEISTLQRTRGRRIARTEVMNAHVKAAGTRYQEYGVTKVKILTSNPCPQCVAFKSNEPYKVGEAMSGLPVHPNCVCTIAPAET